MYVFFLCLLFYWWTFQWLLIFHGRLRACDIFRYVKMYCMSFLFPIMARNVFSLRIVFAIKSYHHMKWYGSYLLALTRSRTLKNIRVTIYAECMLRHLLHNHINCFGKHRSHIHRSHIHRSTTECETSHDYSMIYSIITII